MATNAKNGLDNEGMDASSNIDGGKIFSLAHPDLGLNIEVARPGDMCSYDGMYN